MVTDNALVTGKRRLKRLPVAPHIVSSDHFKPTASDWKRLQTAFGAKLGRRSRMSMPGWPRLAGKDFAADGRHGR
jgi:hypothetical protein